MGIEALKNKLPDAALDATLALNADNDQNKGKISVDATKASVNKTEGIEKPNELSAKKFMDLCKKIVKIPAFLWTKDNEFIRYPLECHSYNDEYYDEMYLKIWHVGPTFSLVITTVVHPNFGNHYQYDDHTLSYNKETWTFDYNEIWYEGKNYDKQIWSYTYAPGGDKKIIREDKDILSWNPWKVDDFLKEIEYYKAGEAKEINDVLAKKFMDMYKTISTIPEDAGKKFLPGNDYSECDIQRNNQDVQNWATKVSLIARKETLMEETKGQYYIGVAKDYKDTHGDSTISYDPKTGLFRLDTFSQKNGGGDTKKTSSTDSTKIYEFITEIEKRYADNKDYLDKKAKETKYMHDHAAVRRAE